MIWWFVFGGVFLGGGVKNIKKKFINLQILKMMLTILVELYGLLLLYTRM